MTPAQLRAALNELNITQAQCAELLGHHPDGRTVRRWVSGESEIPPTAAILIRMLLSGKITIKDIENA